MEDGEIEGTHPEEPTAPGHQTTEALPPSAALGDRPASKPDERAGRGAVNYIILITFTEYTFARFKSIVSFFPNAT